MPLPPGRSIPLSLPRRLMCDLMHLSRRVPLVAIERRLDLSAVVRAREALGCRPSWFALFLKAFGLVAWQREEFRRSFLSFPWAHLHQHACNVASLAIERRVGDEDAVLFLGIRDPERRSLGELHATIRAAKTLPLEQVPDYRRQLLLGRLPAPLRRLAGWAALDVCGDWRARFLGTFGVTGVSGFGSASLNLLSPLTSTLTFGVIDADGCVTVRLFYDHRVLDGVASARALEDLEQTFQGPILAELRRPLPAAIRLFRASSRFAAAA